MPTTVATHIYLDERGRPWIEGTNTKVIEVVMDKIAWGWEPEHIHRQYPHLPLAKIYAAFSYYYDHKDEIDAEIERQTREAETLWKQQAPLREKLLERLRARGTQP